MSVPAPITEHPQQFVEETEARPELYENLTCLRQNTVSQVFFDSIVVGLLRCATGQAEMR